MDLFKWFSKSGCNCKRLLTLKNISHILAVHLTFDAFICYKRNSGEDFAEHLQMGLEELGIHTFLDIKDIPEKFRGTDEWTTTRDNALIESKNFLLIITAGFELSVEIKKELSLARKSADKKFIYLRHCDLRPHLKITLDTEELDLGKQQQIIFETKQELLRKAVTVLKEHKMPTTTSNDKDLFDKQLEGIL